MSKRNQDVTQSRNDYFPRNVSSAKRRQSLRASVISLHSFRRESVGSNVLIIVGLTLSFSGVTMTMTGVYAEFAHTETKLTILGIGPSLIGIGIFFLLLRLFFCGPHICGCCREVNQLFPTNNTITPCTSCTGPLSRTTVKSTGEKTTFCSPGCSETTVKPAIRSSDRSVTSGKVNFLPENEEKNVDTRNNLLDEKRENNTAGQLGSDTTRPNTEERFVSVISASRKQEIKSGKNDESRLNVGSKPTTSSSMDFLDELGEI